MLSLIKRKIKTTTSLLPLCLSNRNQISPDIPIQGNTDSQPPKPDRIKSCANIHGQIHMDVRSARASVCVSLCVLVYVYLYVCVYVYVCSWKCVDLCPYVYDCVNALGSPPESEAAAEEQAEPPAPPARDPAETSTPRRLPRAKVLPRGMMDGRLDVPIHWGWKGAPGASCESGVCSRALRGTIAYCFTREIPRG